jgi:hypothetical protein
MTFDWSKDEVIFKDKPYKIIRFKGNYIGIELTVRELTSDEIAWTFWFTRLQFGICENIHDKNMKYNGCQDKKFYFYDSEDKANRTGFITYKRETNSKDLALIVKGKSASKLPDHTNRGEVKQNYSSGFNLIVMSFGKFYFEMSEVCVAKLGLLLDNTPNAMVTVIFDTQIDVNIPKRETYKLFKLIEDTSDNIFSFLDRLFVKKATL